jgi:hypothetical protein
LGALLAAAVFTGCIREQPADPFSPLIPPEPPDNPQILSAAWTADVFRNQRKVIIKAPKKGLEKRDLQVLGEYFGVAPGSPDLSILAGDVVDILPQGTLSTSALGAFIPGQVRTTFALQVRNKLTAVNITTPTFPEPPAGTQGVILFPFEIVVTQTPGSVSIDPANPNYVLVELPNQGLVAPSVDWDINPFNFFNDTGCGAGSNDCYRSEAFFDAAGSSPVLQGGATSQSRTVGFDHDPTVSQFRVRMILAGDLQDATPNTPPTANAGGPYTSARGVPVTLNGSGTDPDPGASLTFAWDFDADGQYDDATGANASFPCSTGGVFTIGLRVTDNRGASATATAQVTCTDSGPTANAGGPYNGVVGTPITLSGSGTDDGAITAFAWDLDNDGQFDDSNLQNPSYTCSAAGAFIVRLQVTDNAVPPQTGVAQATVNCVAAAAGTVRGRWVSSTGAPITSAASGATIFLEIDVQMAAGQNIDAFQGRVNFPAAQITAFNAGADLNCSGTGAVITNPGQATCPAGAPPANNEDFLDQYTGNNSVAGELSFQNFSIAGNGTGIQGLARLRFTAGTAGAAAPTLTILLATGNGGTSNITSSLVITIPSITIN